MSDSINKKTRNRRKEKALAITIIITTTSILVLVMLVGKMLGREMSAQQEVLIDQFPLKNISATQDELGQLMTYQPHSQIILFVVFAVSSIVTFGGLLFVKKFTNTR